MPATVGGFRGGGIGKRGAREFGAGVPNIEELSFELLMECELSSVSLEIEACPFSERVPLSSSKAAWRLIGCDRVEADFVLDRGSESELFEGPFLVNLGGVSEPFGTFSFPFVSSRSKTRERFEVIEGGLDVSVALGDPGIGASCTLITFCRFEPEGYLGCVECSVPEAFLTIGLIPLALWFWP